MEKYFGDPANAFTKLASRLREGTSHFSDLANELEVFANHFYGSSNLSGEQRHHSSARTHRFARVAHDLNAYLM